MTHQPLGVTEVMTEEFNRLHDGKLAPRTSSPKALFQAIHDLPAGERRSALCLSGGGIRSASFALGVLQGLAGAKVLRHFHYLSTVSGGGYIGAWLSVWRAEIKDDKKLMKMLSRRRLCEAEHLVKVEKDIGAAPKERYRPEDAYKEPVELEVLRAHSNFLTPKLGAMSADTWSLIALYIRNLLLNWAVYLPLIFAIVLVPVLSLATLSAVRWSSVELHHFVLIAAIVLFTIAVFTSVRGRLAQDKRYRVDQTAFLSLELAPIYIASMLVCVYSVGSCNVDGSSAECWAHGIGPGIAACAGSVIYGVGWLFAFLRFGDLTSFFRRPERGNPITPLVSLVFWTISGAAAGALVGVGLDVVKQHHADLKPIVVLGVGWIAVSIFLGNAIYLALTSLSVLGDLEREWLARSAGWFVAMTVVWAGFSALVLYADSLLDLAGHGWSKAIAPAVGGGIGGAAALIGKSSSTLASLTGKNGSRLPMSTILAAGSMIFLVSLVVVFAHVSHLLERHVPLWQQHQTLTPFITLIGCGIFVLVVSYFVNVNRFSAHSMYRNRLIRAFLGSARGPRGQLSVSRDPFTGFDNADNVFVRDLVHPDDRPRLFPVINMALNTVAGANNAWQERKAESFSVTPLHSGNEWVNYWPTRNYGSRINGLSLGTAIAISGAAASPNMGYHSSPLVGLVMTLFNVRLGWWLGNPSKPRTAPQESPPFGMVQFLSELFGLTNDKSQYVYLSDGGHFENLGIYEMVRRRNHFILVSDAGCDPDCAFADLGNAMRKIWIDLGIKITFETLNIVKRGDTPKKGEGVYCAVGTIVYPERPDEPGHIVYLKPCYLGTEPADVRAYAADSPTFPHETTADQFFTESQMESYRSLGAHVIEKVLGAEGEDDPDAPMAALGPYWKNIRRFGQHA
jgi:hypothetical protein